MKQSFSILLVSIFFVSACGNNNAGKTDESSDTLQQTDEIEIQIDSTSQVRDSLAADGTLITFYKPQGVCSTMIEVHTKDGVIGKVIFTNGCPGNTMGVSKLIEGMTIDEAISRIEGITCGQNPTSCPDQLSKALKTIKTK